LLVKVIVAGAVFGLTGSVFAKLTHFFKPASTDKKMHNVKLRFLFTGTSKLKH
jgi:hypothetical protein